MEKGNAEADSHSQGLEDPELSSLFLVKKPCPEQLRLSLKLWARPESPKVLPN